MCWWENESIVLFRSPTTCMISGATMSGKAHFIYHILRNAKRMSEIPPQKKLFTVIVNINLYSKTWSKPSRMLYYIKDCHLDQIEEWTEAVKHTVFILDDLMTQVAKSKGTVVVFSITAHHKNCTVFFDTKFILSIKIFSLFVFRLPLRRFI